MLSDTMMLGGGRKAAYPIENSLLFRGAQYLSRTPSVPGNRKTWTWSGWVRRGPLGVYAKLFAGVSSIGTNDFTELYFNTSNQLEFLDYTGGSIKANLVSLAVFRDPTAWLHVVVAVDTTQPVPADRVNLYVNGERVSSFATATHYSIQHFETSVNAVQPHVMGRYVGVGGAFYLEGYLAEVAFVDNAALTASSFGEVNSFTGSWRPKKLTGIAWGVNGFYLGKPWDSASLGMDYVPGDYARIYGGVPSAPHGGSTSALNDNDPTTSCSMLAFNGVSSISQGILAKIDLGSARTIRKLEAPGAYWTHATTGTICRFYVSDDGVNWSQFGADSMMGIASAPLTASATGSAVARYVAYGLLVGSWYGDYYTISLSELRVFGEGISSGNDWKATGFVAADVVADTPTNVYATLNAISQGHPTYVATGTLSDGNLVLAATDNHSRDTTLAAKSGKYYAEVTVVLGGTKPFIGVRNFDVVQGNAFSNTGDAAYVGNATKQVDGQVAVPFPGASSYGTGDVIGVALDIDGLLVSFYKNGLFQGSIPLSVAGARYGFGVGGANNANTFATNFGQRPFVYTPPAGFKPLCTANLPPTSGTTSGTFSGNANAEGPCIFTGAVPLTLTINGNAVTWGVHADKLATGFKIRTASASYNMSGSNSWTATYDRKPTVGAKGRAPANAQSNP